MSMPIGVQSRLEAIAAIRDGKPVVIGDAVCPVRLSFKVFPNQMTDHAYVTWRAYDAETGDQILPRAQTGQWAPGIAMAFTKHQAEAMIEIFTAALAEIKS